MGCNQAFGIGGMGELFREQALHAFFELFVPDDPEVPLMFDIPFAPAAPFEPVEPDVPEV